MRPKGDAVARQRVVTLLQGGDACWCPVARLELWNGAGGTQEQKILRDLERLLPMLPINEKVWETSIALARKARAAGVTVPATDLLIAACAKVHRVDIEATDSDFEAIRSLED
jgi:predicted nucleic acid-binding protein